MKPLTIITYGAIGAAFLAPVAVGPIDQGSANVQADCKVVKLTNWPTGPVNLDDLTITVDGKVFQTGKFRFVSEGLGSSEVIDVPEGFVSITATRGMQSWTSSAPCVLTPVPTPETVPPPPIVGSGNPPTCADLAILYPKAGKARRIAWGCATPTPPNAHKVVKISTKRLVRAVPCTATTRSYRVYRTDRVWTRDDVVILDRTHKSVVYGKVCKSFAVAGSIEK